MAHTTRDISKKLKRKALKRVGAGLTKNKAFKTLPSEITEKESTVSKNGYAVSLGLAVGIAVLLALAFTLGR